jgi:hypothetical protein
VTDGSDVPPELRLESLAMLYRRLAQDQAAVVDFVGVKLAHALPGCVDVRRKGLLGSGPIERVRVTLGDLSHELAVHHGGVETTRGALVGGVVLRHEAIPVSEWITSLLSRLEQFAVGSDSARAALEQLN